jgi:ATP-dependent Clp protease protease subunit
VAPVRRLADAPQRALGLHNRERMLPDPAFPGEQALFDRRIVLLTGAVDQARADRVAASLVSLAVAGPEPVELRIGAESDALDVAFSLMDTIDTLEAPVDATVAGLVAGTLVGVLAACRHRRMGASARIHLREPRAELEGAAAEMQRQARDLEGRLERFARRVAQATGRPLEHVEADMRTGRFLDAGQAVAYGLIDEILEPRKR